jgi:hypothetical protein
VLLMHPVAMSAASASPADNPVTAAPITPARSNKLRSARYSASLR